MHRRRALVFALFATAAASACGRSGAPEAGGIAEPMATNSATPTATATAGFYLTLVDERFDAGSGALQGSVDPVWSDTTGGGFEVYASSGAGARGMQASYDDDVSPATPEVPIPGAIEVNDNGNDVRLTVAFTLPVLPSGEYAGGRLRVWMGNRGNPGGAQQIDLVDVTDGLPIGSTITPTLPSGAAPRAWTFNLRTVAFGPQHAGHDVELRFQSAGNSAEGLQLADLELSAFVVE